ncbi:MAG: iron uptake transporter permease EfeU, partial [Candidatus Nanopelagicales bacterium]
MFANYLIGLREGIEAALIVSILVAYLVKTGRREHLRWVWVGVAGAVILSVVFAVGLSVTSESMSERAGEIFAGVASVVAVVFVTWMVFWMKKAARGIKGELHDKLDEAVAMGVVAIGLVAFLAVVREGLETALFLWTTARATGEGATAVLGGLLGLATAVVLGYLFYRGALRINLGAFFKWTGVVLIIIAAGVLSYAVHEFQEVGLLPGDDAKAFDLSAAIPMDSWYGELMRGFVNWSSTPSWLQVLAWVSYVAVVMTLFLRPSRTSKPPVAAQGSA